MPLAGQVVKASDIPVTTYTNKAATETVTSQTTVQDDDHLAVELTPGVWRVQLVLTATGSSSGDIAVTWSNTGTMSVIGRLCHGPGVTTASTDDGSAGMTGRALTSTVNYGITGVAAGIYEELLVEVSATSTLQLRWAQATSNATGTTLSTSSRMFVTPVEAF